MTVWVVGASHRTAPVEVRERLHVGDDEREPFLLDVLDDDRVRGCTVLSTCNRSELYLRLVDGADAGAVATGVFARRSGLSGERVRSHLYAIRGREAASHLFRVTSGLDSLVMGEPQIQGQVSAAYRAARDAEGDALGPVLHRLFQSALAAGGAVRAETGVAEGAGSVPAAAVRLATKVFGDLESRTAVVLGAGEMGRLTLSTLRDRGVGDAVVASRTDETAANTARETGARAVSGDEALGMLDRADILITSTSARSPVVTADRLRSVRDGAAGPMVVIDIAVPRDVDPEVAELRDVFLYNVDDLQRVVRSTERSREVASSTAEELLEERVAEFWAWVQAREAVPVIRSLRDRAERIREREMSEALSDVGGLSEEDRQRIHRASRLVLKKVLHAPTVGLRELAAEDEAERVLELARRLFGLDAEETEATATGGAGDPDGAPGGDGGRRDAAERGRATNSDTEDMSMVDTRSSA